MTGEICFAVMAAAGLAAYLLVRKGRYGTAFASVALIAVILAGSSRPLLPEISDADTARAAAKG